MKAEAQVSGVYGQRGDVSGKMYRHLPECGFVVLVHAVRRVPDIVVAATQAGYSNYFGSGVIVEAATTGALQQGTADIGVKQSWGEGVLPLFIVCAPFAQM